MEDKNFEREYFGSWKIVDKIGEGSFGTVYKLERNEYGITYTAALKIITIPQSPSEIKSLISEGYDDDSIVEYFEGFVSDFVSEIALMAKLKGNTNIVSYEDHAVIKEENEPKWEILIRMEYLTPVLEYYQNHETVRKDIIKLGIDICSALELCQRYNIVHRDIKPENIFVSANGDYKLGDFGIARTVEKTMGVLSKKGTYTYMAPEVYKGEEYGTNIDLYSLGLVLYRFLNNNKTPFLSVDKKVASYQEREIALTKRMSGCALPKPVNATDRLAEIVLKACAYDPNMRYTSPAQMKADLEAVYYDKSDSAEIFFGSDKIDVHKSAFTNNRYVSEQPHDSNNEKIQSESFDKPDYDPTVGVFDDIEKLKAKEEAERQKKLEDERRKKEEEERQRKLEEEKRKKKEEDRQRQLEEEKYKQEEAERQKELEEAKKLKRQKKEHRENDANNDSESRRNKNMFIVIAVIIVIVLSIIIAVAISHNKKNEMVNASLSETTESTETSETKEITTATGSKMTKKKPVVRTTKAQNKPSVRTTSNTQPRTSTVTSPPVTAPPTQASSSSSSNSQGVNPWTENKGTQSNSQNVNSWSENNQNQDDTLE